MGLDGGGAGLRGREGRYLEKGRKADRVRERGGFGFGGGGGGAV